MFLHQAKGIRGFDRLMQPNVTESLLNHFNSGQSVVFHLEQRNLEFISPINQLRQRFAGSREDEALGGSFQGSQLAPAVLLLRQPYCSTLAPC